MKKKILVTGAAGFLGSHLSEKLSILGHEVVGIDNMMGGYEDNIPKNIEFKKIDCCDFESIQSIIKNINVVYHCAATAHEGLSVFSPYEITKNNYLASTAVFSAAVNANEIVSRSRISPTKITSGSCLNADFNAFAKLPVSFPTSL